MNEMTLTYQTRLHLNKEQEALLEEYASLFNMVEHKLFAEIAKGNTSASCKNEFLKKFEITARQFNSARVSIEAKIAAAKAIQEDAILRLKQQIALLEKQILRLENKPTKSFVLHQKKRRKASLQTRLLSIESDKKHNRVRLCLGGKKLFHSQFHLEENGFNSHAEWKKAWEDKRKSEFFLLGSKDETSGNQSCTASPLENGLSLRLRLPKKLEKNHGKYLSLENVLFSYGQEAILSALSHPNKQAISYRFKKDHKSWRLFVSTEIAKEKLHSIEGNGVIGLDLNVNHIAYAETDRFGNLIEKKIFPWNSYGKTKDQLKAITGDLCKEIVNLAKQAKKPIVIEKLDFKKKKLSLRDGYDKLARLLSSFAYGLFYGSIHARAFKNGIQVHKVNPAFTSVIGHFNYASRYGLSIHLAAALCIARRHLNFSETPCSSNRKIPDRKGCHVAFVLPERNRTKHVWHFWGQVKKKIKTVLAAHFQVRNQSLSPFKPTLATADRS